MTPDCSEGVGSYLLVRRRGVVQGGALNMEYSTKRSPQHAHMRRVLHAHEHCYTRHSHGLELDLSMLLYLVLIFHLL